MEYIPTEIEDILLIKPSVFRDDRGFFFESYRESQLQKQGLDIRFVQDNVSFSAKNSLRGLHYQVENPQDKLLMVLQGEILDVAVDLRTSSKTFGQYISRILSAENKHQMLIPKGFAHGFLVLSENALVHYKCSDYYNSDGERGLRWDDHRLGINWDVKHPILSEKDQNHPGLSEIPDEDLFE